MFLHAFTEETFKRGLISYLNVQYVLFNLFVTIKLLTLINSL